MKKELDTELKQDTTEQDSLDSEPSEDAAIDYIPKKPVLEQLLPQESKEFFQLETPDSFKIVIGSCCLRVDGLRDMAIEVYEYLKEKGNKNNGQGSYLG